LWVQQSNQIAVNKPDVQKQVPQFENQTSSQNFSTPQIQPQLK
jgi:hypothetical protein